jgi:hypothetical protein
LPRFAVNQEGPATHGTVIHTTSSSVLGDTLDALTGNAAVAAAAAVIRDDAIVIRGLTGKVILGHSARVEISRRRAEQIAALGVTRAAG